MPKPVISVENLSKTYQLGQINTGTLSRDLQVYWARVRGKPNPLLRIGQEDHGNRAGETIWALKDVSFDVEQGEVLGIIGRNGAGKSTLLKILSRVTAPTSGRIKVKGRIASLLEVGTGFHPELTGRENIYLNGAILGMTRAEITRKLDEIVSFAEIEKFVDTPVKRYSSGMYVRLAFAVAAHLDSEILIVDEVLAVGDAEFQKKCLGKMGDVASKEGRTVLFVSHNMGAINNLCPNSMLLDTGRKSNYGETSKVVQHYLSGKSSEFEVILPSHPKSNIAIRRVWLGNSEGKLANSILANVPFSIGVEFSVNQKIKNCEIYFRLYNEVGTPLLTSKLTDTLNASVDFESGIHRYINIIPSPFLAPGNYSLMVAIGQPQVEITERYDHILSFEVQEAGSKMWMYYGNKKHGNILVQFPWKKIP
jgi:lipopolysaccharide transport system ATP-binding protein